MLNYTTIQAKKILFIPTKITPPKVLLDRSLESFKENLLNSSKKKEN